VIDVVTGDATAAAPGGALVVRVAPYTGQLAAREATVGVAVADPALAEALIAAIARAVRDAAQATEPPVGAGAVHDTAQATEPSARAGAVRDAAHATEPPAPVRTVRVRSRKGLARDAGQLGGAIAIVPVTPRNARHLIALVDGARAAGALGVQLVWDGVDPPRATVEHRVFAALEHARATPGAPPVVLAACDRPAPALCFLIAHRTPYKRRDEPR
jgi:hypothetical protein